jgi:co-chaperonin GroES (HSP10)
MPKIPDEIKEKALKDIEPLRNNVYIYILPRITKLGLIEMPEQHREYTEKAMVIAVGKDVEELKEGDTILIPYHEGTHLQVEETFTKSSLHRIIVEHNITTKVGGGYV